MASLTVPPASATARILIVDDDSNCVRGLMHLLEGVGYSSNMGMTDPTMAMSAFVQFQPDLVLLDWHMEKATGMEVLKAIQEAYPAENVPPIIVLTGDDCNETKRKALEAGVSDFLTKPLNESEVVLRIRNQLRLRTLHQHVQSENARLEQTVHERTAKLRRTIEELNDLQQQVIAEERMHAFRTMAGGVAHDFNNSLMVIRGYSELYAGQDAGSSSPEEMHEAFETIALASRDGAEIVRRLREFYRPYSPVDDGRQPAQINKLVEESIAMARPKWETQCRASGICVAVTVELAELPVISASPVEIREVLMNLILNAVDAMPQGGAIVIRTRPKGDGVAVEVEDTGTGMTAETLRRCLEPFYSTKGERGTGLGLSIIYGIVQRHGGSIGVRSVLNQGSCISFILPLGAEESLFAKDAPLLPIHRHLRILVVDDDPSVCSVVSRYLQLDEHSVTVAGNGCEALEKFNAGTFDLVITDRVMPKMSGDQLASAIHAINPAEPIILLTGFDGRSDVTDGANLFVPKPASMASIRDAISRVMPA